MSCGLGFLVGYFFWEVMSSGCELYFVGRWVGVESVRFLKLTTFMRGL